jgi:Ran GTPase-activating protein (RanGAP) involved in mRNA processing and transport
MAMEGGEEIHKDCVFLNSPPEMTQKILGYLGEEDLASTRLVCKPLKENAEVVIDNTKLYRVDFSQKEKLEYVKSRNLKYMELKRCDEEKVKELVPSLKGLNFLLMNYVPQEHAPFLVGTLVHMLTSCPRLISIRVQDHTLGHVQINITDEDMKILASALRENNTLAELILPSTEISGKGVACLAETLKGRSDKKGGNLLSLGLPFTRKLRDEGAKILGEVLAQKSPLQSLDLTSCSIGDEGAKFLSKGLKHNSNLTHLNLSDNSVNNKGIISLSNMLKINKALRSLRLDSNRFGEEAFKALAEAMNTNTTLTRLNLNCTYKGIKFLSSLQGHLYLKELELNGNNLTGGFNFLCDLLERENDLEALNLSYTFMKDKDAKKLAQVLEKNTRLTYLDLKRNNIGKKGVTALARMLGVNRALRVLNLRHIEIEAERKLVLIQALRENKTLQVVHFSKPRGRESPEVEKALADLHQSRPHLIIQGANKAV